MDRGPPDLGDERLSRLQAATSGLSSSFRVRVRHSLFQLVHRMLLNETKSGGTRRQPSREGRTRRTLASIAFILIDFLQLFVILLSPEFGWTPGMVEWTKHLSITALFGVDGGTWATLSSLLWTFLALQAICVALAIFGMYRLRIGATFAGLPLKLLRFLIPVLLTALYIPMMRITLTPISCMSMQMSATDMSAEACWLADHLVMLVVTLIINVLFLAFTIAFRLMYFDSTPNSIAILARASSRNEALGSMVRLLLVALLHLLGPSQRHVLIGFSIAALTFLTARSIVYPSYYRKSLDVFHVAANTTAWWLAVAAAILQDYGTGMSDGGTMLEVILLGATPVLPILGVLLWALRHKFLKDLAFRAAEYRIAQFEAHENDDLRSEGSVSSAAALSQGSSTGAANDDEDDDDDDDDDDAVHGSDTITDLPGPSMHMPVRPVPKPHASGTGEDEDHERIVVAAAASVDYSKDRAGHQGGTEALKHTGFQPGVHRTMSEPLVAEVNIVSMEGVLNRWHMSEMDVELMARILMEVPTRRSLLFVRLMLEGAIEALPDSTLIRVTLASYILTYSPPTENAHAISLLATATQLSAPIDSRFAVFSASNELLARHREMQVGSEQAHGADALGMFEFKKEFKEAETSMRTAINAMLLFWTKLMSGLASEDSNVLDQAISSLHSATQDADRAESKFIGLLERFPNHSALLRAYGIFLINIRYMHKNGQQYIRLSEDRDEEDKPMRHHSSSKSSQGPGSTAGSSMTSGSGLATDALRARRARAKQLSDNIPSVRILSRGTAIVFVVLLALVAAMMAEVLKTLDHFTEGVNGMYMAGQRRKRLELVVMYTRGLQLAALADDKVEFDMLQRDLSTALSEFSEYSKFLYYYGPQDETIWEEYMSPIWTYRVFNPDTLPASSWRNETTGSWFLENLFLAHASQLLKMDLNDFKQASMTREWRFVMDNTFQALTRAFEKMLSTYQVNDHHALNRLLTSLAVIVAFKALVIVLYSAIILTGAIAALLIVREEFVLLVKHVPHALARVMASRLKDVRSVFEQQTSNMNSLEDLDPLSQTFHTLTSTRYLAKARHAMRSAAEKKKRRDARLARLSADVPPQTTAGASAGRAAGPSDHVKVLGDIGAGEDTPKDAGKSQTGRISDRKEPDASPMAALANSPTVDAKGSVPDAPPVGIFAPGLSETRFSALDAARGMGHDATDFDARDGRDGDDDDNGDGDDDDDDDDNATNNDNGDAKQGPKPSLGSPVVENKESDDELHHDLVHDHKKRGYCEQMGVLCSSRFREDRRVNRFAMQLLGVVLAVVGLQLTNFILTLNFANDVNDAKEFGMVYAATRRFYSTHLTTLMRELLIGDEEMNLEVHLLKLVHDARDAHEVTHGGLESVIHQQIHEEVMFYRKPGAFSIDNMTLVDGYSKHAMDSMIRAFWRALDDIIDRLGGKEFMRVTLQAVYGPCTNPRHHHIPGGPVYYFVPRNTGPNLTAIREYDRFMFMYSAERTEDGGFGPLAVGFDESVSIIRGEEDERIVNLRVMEAGIMSSEIVIMIVMYLFVTRWLGRQLVRENMKAHDLRDAIPRELIDANAVLTAAFKEQLNEA